VSDYEDEDILLSEIMRDEISYPAPYLSSNRKLSARLMLMGDVFKDSIAMASGSGVPSSRIKKGDTRTYIDVSAGLPREVTIEAQVGGGKGNDVITKRGLHPFLLWKGLRELNDEFSKSMGGDPELTEPTKLFILSMIAYDPETCRYSAGDTFLRYFVKDPDWTLSYIATVREILQSALDGPINKKTGERTPTLNKRLQLLVCLFPATDYLDAASFHECYLRIFSEDAPRWSKSFVDSLSAARKEIKKAILELSE
tara:strand:+ start:326 stop:1090 length:765 start_codon:yes stop_codon:yes gene_type:complete